MPERLDIKEIQKRLKIKKLKFISLSDDRKNITFRCFCGKIKITSYVNAIQRATSCGCNQYQYNKGNKNYLWKGYGEISAKRWYAIKNNAKIRSILFDITIEQAWEKFLEQNKSCAICGKNIKISDASLDRIDSSIGYTYENIQWVKKEINSMKWDLPIIKFIKWCKLICKPIVSNIDYSKQVNLDKSGTTFMGYKGIYLSYFTEIKKKAEIRNLDFNLKIEDFWNLFVKQGGKCAITGIRLRLGFKKKQTASLDRIDSNKGYNKDNIQWVHKIINVKIKRDIEEKTIKKIAEEIYENYENKQKKSICSRTSGPRLR